MGDQVRAKEELQLFRTTHQEMDPEDAIRRLKVEIEKP
jgi:hypothetical protein